MATNMKTHASIPSLRMSDFIAALPILCAWRNSKGRIMPIHGLSAPGMGKTAIAEEAARQMAKQHPGEPVGYHVDNLGNRTPADVPGYTLFDTITHPDGRKERISVFTRPTVFLVSKAFLYLPDDPAADADGFLESTVDDSGQSLFIGCNVFGKSLVRGLTVLDEFNQADVEVRKVAAPLLDEGRVATHKLPRDWAVWAFSNRAKDASGTGRALAFLTNRTCMVELQAEKSLLEGYFMGQDMIDNIEPLSVTLPPTLRSDGRVVRNNRNVDSQAHPAMMAMLNATFEDMTAGVPTDPGQPFLTPRSFEAVSNLFDITLRLSIAGPDGNIEPGMSYLDSFINRRETGSVEGVTGDTTARWRVFQALAGGAWGVANEEQFLAKLELFNEIPTIDEILANPAKTHVSPKTDAQFIVANIISNSMNTKNIDGLSIYAKRLSPALYQNIMFNALTRDGSLNMTQAGADFFSRNPDGMLRMMMVRAKAEESQVSNTKSSGRR